MKDTSTFGIVVTTKHYQIEEEPPTMIDQKKPNEQSPEETLMIFKELRIFNT